MFERVYLERLGLERRPEVNHKVLAHLHERHLLNIPFENLTIRAGLPIQLDRAQLTHKMLQQRRGGFCYELNGLFALLLEDLGYSVQRLQAQVAQADGGFGPDFDHMALLVELDEPLLVDVGFGDSFVHPLSFSGNSSRQRHSWFRIVNRAKAYVLQRREAESEWTDKYRFTCTPQPWSAYEQMCRHHSTSVTSTFTQKVVCSRLTTRGRVTLTGNRLIRSSGEQREESAIASRQVWLEHFQRYFNMAWTPPEQLLSAVETYFQ